MYTFCWAGLSNFVAFLSSLSVVPWCDDDARSEILDLIVLLAVAVLESG